MTTPDDEKLLALARKATPGEWRRIDTPDYAEITAPDETKVALVGKVVDAAYIAAANPSAIIAMIERHRAEVERLRNKNGRANEAYLKAAETAHVLKDRAESAESALAAAQKRIAELEKIEDLADQAMTAFDALVAESGGVYGLHLNGDPAPWSDLMGDGRFQEWLGVFDDLRAALKGETGKRGTQQ